MNEKPNILVSACLLGVHCRYNEKGALDPAVWELGKRASLIPVCPEIMGGLATPRAPAERIGDKVVTIDGDDVTEKYLRGAKETLALARLYGCRLAVMKERSPSCGSGMIYDGTHTGTRIPGDGVTAELLKACGISVYGESEVKDNKWKEWQMLPGDAGGSADCVCRTDEKPGKMKDGVDTSKNL